MPPLNATIRLRPHHLLCLLAFRGEGYSPGFIAETARLRQSLLADGARVELVRGPDDLCAACPEMKEECLSPLPGTGPSTRRGKTMPGCAGFGVDRLDAAAAELLGAGPGLYRAEELLRSLAGNFNPERGYAVCAGCSWLERMDCPRVIAARLKEL